MADKRTVLTIATGKKIYLDMAVNLARSFRLWHEGLEITFKLVTDQKQYLPKDILSTVQVMEIQPEEFGKGFSPKLSLDKFAEDGQTLFIDSDCLIYGNLSRVFDDFKGHAVSVVGDYINDGEWFGDIAAICKKLGVERLPKFNGGVYYLEKGEKTTQVYSKARELENSYDEIGFVRLRSRANDEVLIAAAMALNGQTPIPDDGTILSDPQACPGNYTLNILKGKRQLINPPVPDLLHQAWYPFEKVSPLIVHFLGYYTQHYPYRAEVYRLEKKLKGEPNWKTTLISRLLIEYPERIKLLVKKILRPFYHKLFGARQISASERI